MKLIVGLGNPDKEYLNTFHNLGFMGADEAAKILGAEFGKEKCRALVAETRFGGEKILIAKPLTYMNLSGESVRELISFYKTDLKDIVVIYDDYDLPKGALRIRENGSAGTHNGMKSIIKELGSENFARIRIGFNQGGDCRIPLINLVLSGIKKEDEELFKNSVHAAGAAAAEFAKGEPIDRVMQKYNRIKTV